MPRSALDTYLLELVETGTAELPAVSARRMFGSQGFFNGPSIFATVWKGRVTVKLPDDDLRARALALEGAERWAPGRHSMGAWVVLPEALHDDAESLRAWLEAAHRSVGQRPARPSTRGAGGEAAQNRTKKGAGAGRPRRPPAQDARAGGGKPRAGKKAAASPSSSSSRRGRKART